MCEVRTGYVDRIEEGKAVLVVGTQEVVVDTGVVPEGLKDGMWVQVKFGDSGVVQIELDEGKQKEEEQKVNKLVSDVRKKNKGSRFKRN